MKRILGVFLVGLLTTPAGMAASDTAPSRKPNIVFILADDLGYAELGSYGQTKIKTPNLDQLRADGIKFTQAYSGHAVCAPSRCTLMTGLHTGHSFVRGNLGMPVAGQLNIPADTVTIAKLLKESGYATAVCGKWGLGGPGTDGVPWKQGFDVFCGYLDQWRAHNYYPTYLYKNGKKLPLDNPDFKSHQRLKEPLETEEEYFKRFSGPDYCTKPMIATALDFIDENKEKPFFLYYATPIPHVSIQVPQEDYEQYKDTFDDTPYLGDKGYLPHPQPRAGYAAMVSHMDRNIGKIIDRINALGLADDTLIIFTSDNGPTFNGGSDSTFFESTPFRELKCSIREGGIRVPFIAKWPGKIKAGSTTDLPTALWDMMPTFLEACGETDKIPEGIDGISILPTLTGKGKQAIHNHFYWETGNAKSVRMGDWKGYCRVKKGVDGKIELYDLKTDPKESKNVADQYPEVVAKIQTIMTEGRTDSPYFTLGLPSPARSEWVKEAKKRAEEYK